MRLIATLQDQEKATQLSNYLKSQNIDNECEVTVSNDWGNVQYGAPVCRIWVRDEDHLKMALEIANAFLKDSSNPSFQTQVNQDSKPTSDEPLETKASTYIDLTKKSSKNDDVGARSEWRNEPIGFITLLLLIGCTLLFFFTDTTTFTTETEQNKTKFLPQTPFRYSTLEKNLLYDYPHAFEIIDAMIEKIDTEHITQLDPLPQNLVPLYNQFQKTPYWKGYYTKIIRYFDPSAVSKSSVEAQEVPWFEKIQQGQLWRLITPAFLHAGFLHLFFNMIWLIILGKQLEQRMGWQRYLLFVLFTAILTNTIQYLMSGFNFVGFSGVICAMIAFVWVRQKVAPWEGYLLQTSTVNFVMLFLFSILFLQLFSFYLEIAYNYSFTAGIANSAHFSGLLIGIILGRLNFFSWSYR